VVSLEAARLARNGRDWHTPLEFCGLVGMLIVNEEAIYDPRSTNDRLLLGMKGTMSKMELSVFRQRSIEAMRQKTRRCELHLTVAVGYAKTDDDRIEEGSRSTLGRRHYSCLSQIHGASFDPPSSALGIA
jgi:DNA invertase Pin-like site-specific DNA recombinase